MARHKDFNKTVHDYLAGLPDGEDRAEAIYQATQAYVTLLHELDKVGQAAPGEIDSWSLTSNAAVDHTIRAGKYKRGTVDTMSPFPSN